MSEKELRPKSWGMYLIIGVPMLLFLVFNFLFGGVLLERFVESTIGGNLTSCPGFICIWPTPVGLGWFVLFLFYSVTSLLYVDFVMSLKKREFFRALLFPVVMSLTVTYFMLALTGPFPLRCNLVFDIEGNNRSKCYYETTKTVVDRERGLEICNKIGDKWYRGICVKDLAQRVNDPTMCDLIPDGVSSFRGWEAKTVCNILIARASNDQPICDRLILQKDKDLCVAYYLDPSSY